MVEVGSLRSHVSRGRILHIAVLLLAVRMQSGQKGLEGEIIHADIHASECNNMQLTSGIPGHHGGRLLPQSTKHLASNNDPWLRRRPNPLKPAVFAGITAAHEQSSKDRRVIVFHHRVRIRLPASLLLALTLDQPTLFSTFVTSIIRLYYLLQPSFTSPDQTWDMMPTILWAVVELSLLIICPSMFTLRKFGVRIAPTLFSSSKTQQSGDAPKDFRTFGQSAAPIRKMLNKYSVLGDQSTDFGLESGIPLPNLTKHAIQTSQGCIREAEDSTSCLASYDQAAPPSSSMLHKGPYYYSGAHLEPCTQAPHHYCYLHGGYKVTAEPSSFHIGTSAMSLARSGSPQSDCQSRA